MATRMLDEQVDRLAELFKPDVYYIIESPWSINPIISSGAKLKGRSSTELIDILLFCDIREATEAERLLYGKRETKKN